MNQTYCPYCMTPVTPGEPCPGCGLTEGSYHPQPHHLPPGTVLADRYLLGRVLGEGGFGITYIGCDTRLELRVAVKEYFPGNHVARNCAASPAVTCYDGVAGRGFEKGRERFIREARTMAKMDKTPQIVGVRDFFQANNTAYIVMEYVEGTTFKELVTQKGGKLSTGELLPMLEPLFGALETMHKQGLIHRDISPDNLMLENGMVRLLDFGCARESDKGNETMTIVLKQGYSPVEQYQHKGQGPWTDVYSLAATMYYCLTGKTPPQALDRICDDELIPPRKLGADLTAEQERALLFGMGLQPTRRFRSVQELHAALYRGAPVPLAPVPVESESLPYTREEESGPENGTQTLTESSTQTSPESRTQTPPENGPRTLTESGTETPPESKPGMSWSWEPPAEQAEEPPGETASRETETVQSAEPTEPEAEQTGETDKPAREPAEKPDRKKLFLIGGAVAAAALILALILIIPKLMGPGDPSAEGSEPPASLEPLPEELFDGAARAGDTGEFLELLADDSVSAIIIPEGQGVDYSNGPITISKPVRLEQGAHLWVKGPLTVSSVVDLAEGAWLDQETNFVLTESGALYIGTGSYAHVCNSGMGSSNIAGTVRIAEGGDFWTGAETASLSGTVLAEGHCGLDGKAAVSGTIQVAENGGAWFGNEADISGTVQLAEGGNVWFNGFTTVSGTGRLEINGIGNSGHVVRTVDGGSIAVGGNGWMNFNVLWLEKNTDLNAAGDRISLDQSRYIVADEDVFDNAAHVNNFGELEQAVNDRLVPAIVIDSGFELEYGLGINKPVLISEGVELRASDNSRSPGFSGVTVNYGSVTGFMNLGGQCVYLNYGGTDVSVYTDGGENYLLNMGELNLQNGQYIGRTIVNLGRMRHETYRGEDESYLDLVNTCVANLGEFTVRSGNRMRVGGGYFENRGELTVEENARLENSTHLNSGNVIHIRGALDNNGGILDIDNPDVLSMEGGRVEGGIIQNWGDGSVLEGNESITSLVLTMRGEEESAQASIRETLEQLLETTTGHIRVTGNIEAGDLDLTLNRDLIVEAGAELTLGELTMDGGLLVVRGSLRVETLNIRNGGQLRPDGGRIETDTLTLEDSTGGIWSDLTADAVRLNNARLINWGNMFRCGELTVDGGSDFYDRGNLNLAENAAINVNDGNYVGVNWLEMPSGSITIGDGGRMLLCSGGHLYDGVAVTNRGVFNAANCEFWLNGGASIVNYGHLGFYHLDWQNVDFVGEVTNRGYMHLDGPERVDGVLNNYGDLEIGYGVLQIGGQLNNNGTAYTYNREAGYQGNWSGRALEYR